MNIAIQPARHRRAEESDHGEREKMDRAEPGEKRAAVDERDHAGKREHNPQNDSDADRQFYENAKQVQPEEQDERSGDGRERGAMLAEESADGAGGCTERDENRRKSENESERRGEQP